MMTPSEQARRENIIHAALTARAETDVENAIQDLNRWRREHPEDDSIRDAYEPLILNQMDFASKRQAEAVQPVLTGSAKG